MTNVPVRQCLTGHLAPVFEFYATQKSYCKECIKQRNAANQEARRQIRREQGLPTSEEGFASYRDRLREEATHQHGASPAQPGPNELRGVGFGETEFEKKPETQPRWKIA